MTSIGLAVALVIGLLGGIVAGQNVVAPVVAGSSEVGGQAPPALGQSSYMTEGWYGFVGIGQASTVTIVGVPSMQRIFEVPGLQVQPMFAWGWFDESRKMMGEYTWSDLHHVDFSQTLGVYDGQYVYTNEKGPSNRVSRIDMRTMTTTDVGAFPGLQGAHGFETSPMNEYVGVNGEFRIPVKAKGQRTKGGIQYDGNYDELEYQWDTINDSSGYQSEVHFINPDTLKEECRVRTPGGGPDLSDWEQTGRYYFANAYNEENATSVKGSTEAALSPLWVIDAKDCEFEKTISGASKNGHGVAVDPNNQYLTVAMKLYPGLSLTRLQNEGFYDGSDPNPEPDPEAMEIIKVVQTGDGPLHPWYDDRGNVFTGEFIDSDMVKVKYKPMGHKARFDNPVQDVHVVDRAQGWYIVGHSRGIEMKSISPDNLYGGLYMKLSRDRYINIGPDKPENLILYWLDYGAGDRTRIRHLKETPHDPEPHDMRYVARLKMTSNMPEPKVNLPMYPVGYRKAKSSNVEAIKIAMDEDRATQEWNLPTHEEVRYSKYVMEDVPPFVRDWVEAGYDQSVSDTYLQSEAYDGSGTNQQMLLNLFQQYPYRKMGGVPRPVPVPEGVKSIPSGEAITSQVIDWKPGAQYIEPTENYQDRVDSYSGSAQVYRQYP